MKYVKIIHGWVEQVYNLDGHCVEQKFVQNDSAPVERRALREDMDGDQTTDQLEDDEIIEHSEDVEYIESREKLCEIVIEQPQ
jgi:hypothetical protein